MFKVIIKFRGCPEFETSVTADTAQRAEDMALKMARGCGFDAPVKQIKSFQV